MQDSDPVWAPAGAHHHLLPSIAHGLRTNHTVGAATTGSSPKAPVQTTAGGSCPVPLQYSVSAPQPSSPGQRGHCGEHRQPPGGAALSRLGEQKGKLLQPRGAQLRWVLPRVKGVRPLGVFLYRPDPGSQAPAPRGEAPHRHCASDRTGLQAGGVFCGVRTGVSGSPAPVRPAGPASAPTALGSEGCLGAPGRRGKRGGGHSGEGGGRAYKGPQAGAGKEPPSRCPAQLGLRESRPEFRPGRADTSARAGSGRRDQRARPAQVPVRGRGPREIRASGAPHVWRPALSAMARGSSGPRTSL